MNENQFFIAMYLSAAMASTLTAAEAVQQLKVCEHLWTGQDDRQLRNLTVEQIYRRLGGRS